METAEEKYKIISEMISRDNNLLNISWLCEIAGVSRSGTTAGCHEIIAIVSRMIKMILIRYWRFTKFADTIREQGRFR